MLIATWVQLVLMVNIPLAVLHRLLVLPDQWRRTNESHFFTRQRFPWLHFLRYISGSSLPPFYFSPWCPLSSVIAFKTDTMTLWSIKLIAFATIFLLQTITTSLEWLAEGWAPAPPSRAASLSAARYQLWDSRCHLLCRSRCNSPWESCFDLQMSCLARP